MQPQESKHTYANITKIEGILSSGFSLDRLANETTLDRARLERFLNRDEPLGYGGLRNKECEEKLDIWLADYGHTTEKPLSEYNRPMTQHERDHANRVLRHCFGDAATFIK